MVERLKYLGTTVAYENCVQEEIKIRLNSGNVAAIVFRLIFKDLQIKIYKTIILPRVFYRYETWFLTLREERRLRVFENRVLRRIFGPRREEVAGGCRRLHNEKVYNLYALSYVIRMIKSWRIRLAIHVARMGEIIRNYTTLVELMGRGHSEDLGIHGRIYLD
jgi:hypothetical protein